MVEDYLPLVKCDYCNASWQYDSELHHRHTELEIGGVPQNTFTVTSTPTKLALTNETGIRAFQSVIPFAIKVSLGEGNTPLTLLEDLCGPSQQIYLKDESRNPTKSFKDRGIAVMVSDALRAGKERIAIPSTGNAAISLAKYASSSGIIPEIFVPEATPTEKIMMLEDAEIKFCRDLIACYEECLEYCFSEREVYNGFPAVNIPYLQGVKTISYEIFLEMDGVPDTVLIPCGSGGNIVGIYQGFKELQDLNLTSRIPTIVSIQVKGADPITVGHKRSIEDTVILESIVDSKAEAIASDTCFNYKKIMRILSKTNGKAVSVTDAEIENNMYSKELEYSSNSVFAALRKVNKPGTTVLIGTAGKR